MSDSSLGHLRRMVSAIQGSLKKHEGDLRPRRILRSPEQYYWLPSKGLGTSLKVKPLIVLDYEGGVLGILDYLPDFFTHSPIESLVIFKPRKRWAHDCSVIEIASFNEPCLYGAKPDYDSLVLKMNLNPSIG
jgi:hypothetical protein